jgi:hypothetical protein
MTKKVTHRIVTFLQYFTSLSDKDLTCFLANISIIGGPIKRVDPKLNNSPRLISTGVYNASDARLRIMARPKTAAILINTNA